MDKIQDIVKLLIQQCKVESLSATELVKELSGLFEKVSLLEKDNLSKKEEIDQIVESKKLKVEELNKKIEELKKELFNYKQNFVIPAAEFRQKENDLKIEKFKFDVEREYKNRELGIYSEFVRSLTTTTITKEYKSGGQNGYSYSKEHYVDKPNFPFPSTAIKFGDEK